MKTALKTQQNKFVKKAMVISKPGAVIEVQELVLTDFGLRAITSGSSGIKQGVRENAGPPSPIKKMAPA